MNLIMFDMDGTLFRTETSFFPSVREFAGHHAFPVPDEEFLRSFIGKSGSEWRAWLEQLQLGQSTKELAFEFDLLEQKYVKTQGELYAGAADVLRALALDGWKLGICSNASGWYPEMILTRAGVRDLFMVIRVPSRPDQTKAMMLCEVWNELRPERCAMVGDRADDMQAAYAGGYFAIGAVYGWAPEELELADVRIHDIAEIPMALARHWSQEGETESVSAPMTVASAPVVSEAPALVVPEAPAPEPSVSLTPAATPKDQEPLSTKPKVSVPQPEETPSKAIETPLETALERMVETPATAWAVEAATPKEVVEPELETPAVVMPVEPTTPDQVADNVAEPLSPVQPVEPPIPTSPEPPAKALAVVMPVEPVVTPPAPATPLRSTPEAVIPPPAEPEPAAVTRRSWNPFRRHEDKPR
ncbi:HAD family hydrolase [Candidatus Cryosericum terrychapinii]|jgi:phosphoglycolate phosphatase|uniref:HAD family hydrolase n=1 Tax=Candidatus Cryosericum terrychapinii TaxID=2290919 RepID=UPI001402453E|nr:HAD family hydrolase [Candidatus Cryosericum terrychapinii]